MRMWWHNHKDPNINPEDYLITKQYTPVQKFVIGLFIVLLFPVMLVLYPIGLLLWGAFKLAGLVGFYLAGICFKKKNDKHCYKYQFIRSWLSREAASLPHINSRFRTALYRLSGINIGKNCFIGLGGILEDLYPERVIIEDNVSVSFGVTFIAHGPGKNTGKPTVLHHHSYVGARATLLPGIEIGSYATVGAGSVVTKDVPAGAIVAGSPARIVRYKEGFAPTEIENN